MAPLQRRGALRIESSCLTVPELVVLLIVGVVPIDLLSKELKHSLKEDRKLEETLKGMKSPN